jgi:hypothetical protein
MPASVILFKIYCGFVALLGLLWAVIGILGVTGITEPELGLLETVLTEGDDEARRALLEEEKRDQMGMAIAGPIIFAAYLFGSLMPRRNWALIAANVLLGISLLACITLIPGVLLLVFINQRPAIEYFAR